MPREIFSRATDSVKSKLLPQRGLKATLRREVKSCLDYFDGTDGGPISSLHVNGLTIGKLETGKGYYIEIQEYRDPGEIDDARFTYKDRIIIQGRKITMRRVSPVETSARQSIPRKEVEKVIYMIQHVTVPYREKVEGRKERREKVAGLFTRIRGRFPVREGR
jgi:hypothetical protein